MSVQISSDILDSSYQEHEVFALLNDYMQFYDDLSFNSFCFISHGIKAAVCIESIIYSSIIGTLQTIELSLRKGRINDAFALIRKYDDELVTSLYVSCYLKNNLSIENGFVVDKINKWIQDIQPLTETTKDMLKYIEKQDTLKDFKSLFDGTYYKHIRKQCNNHMHFNSLSLMMLNNNTNYIPNRTQYLDELMVYLRDFFIYHFILLFTLNPHYMMASDYIDILDMGGTPEEGSQYWVAPFVQDTFDKHIRPYRPDLATALIDNIPMQLE